jgi:hypothetical protein
VNNSNSISTYENSAIRFLNHATQHTFGSFDSSLSNDYNNLLSDHGYVAGNMQIEINNLTVGDNYLVQLWLPMWNNSFTAVFDSIVTLTSGSPSQKSQYAIGRFQATSTQLIIAAEGQPYVLAPALQVRTLAVQEVSAPSTFALSGLALIGLASLRRKKQTQNLTMNS